LSSLTLTFGPHKLPEIIFKIKKKLSFMTLLSSNQYRCYTKQGTNSY